MRLGAVDVHYPATGARAGLVVANDQRFAHIVAEHVRWLPKVERYQPGRFYLRELPALRAVLDDGAPLDLVVIDGYVDLDPHGRAGLGAHLHADIGVPVVGIAKTTFRTATHALSVSRGSSTRPLFVTAVGIPIQDAANLVEGMAGAHRLPDALRRVDRLARGADPILRPDLDGTSSSVVDSYPNAHTDQP